MSIWQHWQNQRELLRSSLTERTSSSEVVYHVRHALLQTEQNALAEIADPTLRQQAGILLNSIKGSLGLLEAHTAGKTWVAQKSCKALSSQSLLWRAMFILLAVGAVVCGFRDEWFAGTLCLAAGVIGAAALMTERKNHSGVLPQDELKITIGVDIERMLTVLDSQLHAAERFLEDFAYLNEQSQSPSVAADPAVISRAVDLMEVLYDCSEEERAPIEEATRQLLMRIGLETADYTEESRHLFNTLPSKSTTRTLSPAILSADEKKLLRRGTAAVRIDAA